MHRTPPAIGLYRIALHHIGQLWPSKLPRAIGRDDTPPESPRQPLAENEQFPTDREVDRASVGG